MIENRRYMDLVAVSNSSQLASLQLTYRRRD